MRKAMILLVLVLGASSATFGQTYSSPASNPKKALTIAGQLSADGKTLVAENDDIWIISNPSVLAGHEGQQITVKCQLSADKSAIHVFVVKTAATEVKYVYKASDSAFRR